MTFGKLTKVAVFCGLSTCLLLGAAQFSEGALIHYTLKLKNDTKDALCSVDVTAFNGWLDDVNGLPAGSTHTFKTTGMNCYYALSGFCSTGKSWGKLKTTCLTGNREVSSESQCTPYCTSSDWFIRRNSKGEYHFYRE